MHFFDSVINKDQQQTAEQLEAQGFLILDENPDDAAFTQKLGVVIPMKKGEEKRYVLPNGEALTADEWAVACSA